MPNEIVIRKPSNSVLLPDNSSYTNRFEIKSETSNRKYMVAQSKLGSWWSCSCPGWVVHKHCKHLRAMGLPGNYTPYKAVLK